MKAVKWSAGFIAALYLIFVILILMDVLVGQHFMAQYHMKTFAAPNFLLLIAGLAIAALLTAAAIFLNRHFGELLERFLCRKTIIALAGVLFAVQLYIAKNIFFLSGWDVEMVVNTAHGLLQGQPVSEWYYGFYPNNMFLTLLFALVFKINAAIGVCENEVFALVIMQSLFSSIVSYLVYTVTYEITKNKIAAFFSFCLYVLWVGFSPWFVIPYSDATGILFPILAFRMYQISNRSDNLWLKIGLWSGIGGIVFVGYKIKPQTVIVLVAIIAVEFVKLAAAGFKNKKILFRTGICLLACFVLFASGNLAFSLFLNRHPILETPEERAFGMTHFLMMGLCEETNGTYSDADVDYTKSFETRAERTAGNLRAVKDRLKAMGGKGLVRHLAAKSLVNFGDGTFAWRAEGRFFREISPEPNTAAAPRLRALYYPEGRYYSVFITGMQSIWLTILVLSAFLAFGAFGKKTCLFDDAAVLLLSLLGVMLFITLFEARARYLFTYAPFFVVCASAGVVTLIEKIQKKAEKA